MVFGKLDFRGIEIYVTETRIPLKERTKDLYYYQIRHSDEDWAEPCTIERGVLVNHYGDVVSRVSLDHLFEEVSPISEITLEDFEADDINTAIASARINYYKDIKI